MLKFETLNAVTKELVSQHTQYEIKYTEKSKRDKTKSVVCIQKMFTYPDW